MTITLTPSVFAAIIAAACCLVLMGITIGRSRILRREERELERIEEIRLEREILRHQIAQARNFRANQRNSFQQQITTMTTIEAVAAVREKLPDLNLVSAQKRHTWLRGWGQPDYSAYTIIIQPGRDGTPREQTRGASLEICIELMFPDFTASQNLE